MTANQLAEATEIALKQVVEEGPVAVDDLLGQLAEQGFDVDREELIDELVDLHGIWWLCDTLMRPGHVLPGRVFTHRLTDDELGREAVFSRPDLHLFTLDESSPFASGLGPLSETSFGADPVFRGPDGWLQAFRAGDIVAFRWTGDGALEVERLEVVADGAAEVEALGAAFRKARHQMDCGSLLDVLTGACLSGPELFTGAPPLAELLDRAGLEARGELVAGSGFDWDALARRQHEEFVEDLAAIHALEPEEAEHLVTLMTAREGDGDGDGDGDSGGVSRALADPAAVAAYMDHISNLSANPAAFVEGVRAVAAGVIAATAPSPAPAGAHLLLAMFAEFEGDGETHAREVDRALRSDPNFWAAFEDQAWVLSDRGNARRALPFLAAVVDDEEEDEILARVGATAGAADRDWRLGLLDVFAAAGPMAVGRNDRCPCGSGRKHKACCAATNGYRLVDRVPWLFGKALWFASRPRQRTEIARLVAAAVTDADADADAEPDLIEDFAADPDVVHLALSAGGLMARFHAERGALLPPDESGLLETWAPLRPRMLRVEAAPAALAEPGGGWQFTDVLTGEQFDVAKPPPGRGALAAGAVILSTVAPDGEGLTAPGWIRVTDEIADAVRAAMPALAEGDPVPLLRAVLRPRWNAAVEALDSITSKVEERWEFLFGDADIDDDFLDDVFPEEFIEVLAEDHPEFADAIDRDDDEISIDGETFNPRLHLVMHEIVANQILRGDPDEVWQTTVRLSELGYERHEVLHMLASTVADQLPEMISSSQPYDRESHTSALAALPGSWEQERERPVRHRSHRRRH